MKSIKKNSMILLMITILIVAFVLKDDFSAIVEALLKANILIISFAFICQILALMF